MKETTGADFKSATDSENKKLFIETYGCQMNVADSEVIASIMQMAGYHVCETLDEADAVFKSTPTLFTLSSTTPVRVSLTFSDSYHADTVPHQSTSVQSLQVRQAGPAHVLQWIPHYAVLRQNQEIPLLPALLAEYTEDTGFIGNDVIHIV